MSLDPTTLEAGDLEQHVEWLRRLAHSLVHDDQSADDIAQQTWLKALERRPDTGRPLRAWLTTVVRNFARLRHRAAARRTVGRKLLDGDIEAPPTVDVVARAESVGRLANALVQLGEPYRTTVLLRYAEGLSSAAVAERMGVPEGTARWRLKRGLDQLRERLSEKGDRGQKVLGALLLPAMQLDRPLALTMVAGGALMTVKSAIVVAAAGVLALVAVYLLPDSAPADPQNRDEAASAAEPAPTATDGNGAKRLEKVLREEVGIAPSGTTPSHLVSKPSFKVIGRCLGEMGEPLGGVTIRWLPPGRPLAGRQKVEAPLRDRIRTGVDGRFTWEEPLVDQEYQDIRLRLEQDDRVARTLETFCENGDDLELGDLILNAAGSISGVVTDSSGLPINKATVTCGEVACGAFWRKQGGGSSDVLPATTRADGAVRLVGVPAGWCRVYAAANDSLWSRSDPVGVIPGHPLRDVRVILDAIGPTHFIEGVAQEADGSPLPSAFISHQIRVQDGGSVGTYVSSILTDAQGRFRIRAAEGEAHAFQLLQAGRMATVENVKAGTLDVRLKLPETSYGTILLSDASDRQPIEGANAALWLEVEGGGFGQPVTAASDDSGQLSFPIPNCPFGVTGSAEGYRVSSQSGPFDPLAPPARIDLALEPLPHLNGIVRVSGRPVEGAAVTVASARSVMNLHRFPIRQSRPTTRTATDSDGAFRIPLVPEDQAVYVRASSPGLAPAEVGPIKTLEAPPSTPLILELSAGGAIEGNVFVSEGRSRSGIVVAASRGDAFPVSTRTNAEGAYRLDHLMPGPWQVELRDADFNPRRWSASGLPHDTPIPSNCRVHEGEVTRFDLSERIENQCVLTGTVRLGDVPGPGWEALLLDFPNWDAWRVVSCDPETHDPLDSYGRVLATSPILPDATYRLVLPSPGACVVRIVHRDMTGQSEVAIEHRVRLEYGTQNFDFATGSGSIAGQWSGKPQKARIRFYRPNADGSRLIGRVDTAPDGSFHLPLAPAGELFVRTPSGISRVHVTANETTPLELE
ncbi:MAG: sigma-70 family RNA polymerase sigma factor [Planctomycetota bacterium]